MSKPHLIYSALGVAFAASLGMAQPANALDPQQCLPMAEMNAALRAEGQRTMLIGDREVLNNPTGRIADASITRYMNAVTANPDGSLGYQIEGDLPRSQSSTRVCVRAKLTNVQVFDANRPGVPQQVLLGGQFDVALRADEAIGARPMMFADTIQDNGYGSQTLGLPVVITLNAPYSAGAMMTRRPDGTRVTMMQLGALDYTDAGRERARNGSATLAMLSPR